MNLEEAFETGHLSLLSSWEELTLDEFMRWLRARADQFEEACRKEGVDWKGELGTWIDDLRG